MQAPKAASSRPIRPPDRPSRSADDDDGQEEAREREVAESPEERAGAQERVAPQEAHAVGDPGAQRRPVDRPRVLERRPHQGQRRDRAQVRDGVDGERHGPPDAEQRAAHRRPGQPHHGGSRLLHARGRGQLRCRNDGAQRAGRSRVEEGRAGALDERHDDDLPERQPVERDRGGQAADRQEADEVGADHDRLAVPAVGRDAGDEGEHRGRQHPRERGDAGLDGRAGDGEHQQRVRDRRRLGARAGQQPPGLEQLEVPVARERERGHPRAIVAEPEPAEATQRLGS